MFDQELRNKAKFSLIKKINTVLGICEQLRLIYDNVCFIKDEKLKEKITVQLITALIMAKKMSDRLSYYHKTYNDKTGHNAKNLISLERNKRRVKMRRERQI